MYIYDENNVNDLHNNAGVAKLGDRREIHVNNFMYCALGRNGHLVEKARSSIQTRAKAARLSVVYIILVRFNGIAYQRKQGMKIPFSPSSLSIKTV